MTGDLGESKSLFIKNLALYPRPIFIDMNPAQRDKNKADFAVNRAY